MDQTRLAMADIDLRADERLGPVGDGPGSIKVEHAEADSNSNFNEDDDADNMMILDPGEVVTLTHTGVWCQKGEVGAKILKGYSATLDDLAELVQTKPRIRHKLEDIIRRIDREDTTKAYLLQHHGVHYKNAVADAVKEIQRYHGAVVSARRKLELYEDIQDFDGNDMLGRRKQCLDRAEEAKTKLQKLIADLEEHIDD